MQDDHSGLDADSFFNRLKYPQLDRVGRKMENLPIADFAESPAYEIARPYSPNPDYMSRWQEAEPVNARWAGTDLIVIPWTYLPMSCVLCNQPVDQHSYRERSLMYFNRWLVFLLGGLLGYLIFLLISKECRVSYGYCRAHARSRRWQLFFCGSGMVIGLTLALFAVIRAQRVDLLCAAGLVMFLVALLSLFGVHLIRVIGHHRGVFRLTGFGAQFQVRNPINHSALKLWNDR